MTAMQVQGSRDVMASTVEKVVIEGDLSTLRPDERVAYYHKVCEGIGLNPYSRPLEYIRLNGKLVLYAKRDATDQLRRIHGVSLSIVSRERMDDVYVVTAKATTPDGRVDESIAAVPLDARTKGEALANALMKCETKAKRRVTLSICGLGILDETEVSTIADAKPEPAPPPQNTTAPSTPAVLADNMIAAFRAEMDRVGRSGTQEEATALMVQVKRSALTQAQRAPLREDAERMLSAIKARTPEPSTADTYETSDPEPGVGSDPAFGGFHTREPGEEG
jgi:hypothetical protein